MSALLLTVFFAFVGVAVLGVLAHSGVRALAAFGELRRALEACDDTAVVNVRIAGHAAPRLRIVSSNAPRPLPQPALRAAA